MNHNAVVNNKDLYKCFSIEIKWTNSSSLSAFISNSLKQTYIYNWKVWQDIKKYHQIFIHKLSRKNQAHDKASHCISKNYEHNIFRKKPRSEIKCRRKLGSVKDLRTLRNIMKLNVNILIRSKTIFSTVGIIQTIKKVIEKEKTVDLARLMFSWSFRYPLNCSNF